MSSPEETPATPEAAGASRDQASVTPAERALAAGRRTLEVEARVLADLTASLDDDFVQAVDLLAGATSRVVVTGMGKSGIIGKKIAATFASTGTPSLFMHPAEAIHGDLGMITAQDVVLAISNSGETGEVVRLLPTLELMKVACVAVTSKPESTLARTAQVTLHLPLEEEGCPIGLAPMASTTATLALGDALAAALMDRRGFRPEDFAVFHPGGSLGRRLLTRVKDLMRPLETSAVTVVGTPLSQVLEEMISNNLGAILVLDEDQLLVGILTDGDLKRLFRDVAEAGRGLGTAVEDVMTSTPTVCGPDDMAERALRVMETRAGGQITCLPVVDEDGRALGLIRLHDIVQAKIT